MGKKDPRNMAPQLIESMKALKIPMDHSLAGKTKHNSLAGRNNQFLLVATTACLLESGIPPFFWRYAIRCVSHLPNIEPNDQEVSAWCKVHGEEFKGQGCHDSVWSLGILQAEWGEERGAEAQV